MSVYGYSRVSTAAQAEDGESLETQERQILGRAMQEGWDVDHIHVERGVSGSRQLSERPQGAKLLARLEAGDVVIACKLDRMFRSATDALQMLEVFKERGVSLVLLDMGGDVTGNGIAQLEFTILSAVAQFERERIQERIRDVKRDQRDRGVYSGGSLPFGYQVDENRNLVPVPERLATVDQMIELRREGLSLRKIADAVTSEGVDISPMTVRRVLRDHAAR